MPKRIFITATNTDVGKTYTTQLLLRAYAAMGLRVGVYKPIETGVNGLPQDGSMLLKTAVALNPELRALRIQDIVTLSLPLPAAPYVANKGKKIDLAQFETAIQKIETHCDVVLIEGAGGLLVPIDEDHMIIDLPRFFNAKTLLVTHCRLGCINDTLLSQKALDEYNLPYLWGFNCRKGDESFAQISLPYFKYRFENLFFIEQDIDRLAKALLDTISYH